MTEKSIKKLKKDAWDLCSKYIRLKYADKNGYCTCYTCGKKMYWSSGNQMQAGHGFGGRGGTMLFEEKIIRPQCYSCNIGKGGNYDAFHVKLEKEYGFGFLQEMFKQKNKTHQFTREELENLIIKYKKLVEKYDKQISNK